MFGGVEDELDGGNSGFKMGPAAADSGISYDTEHVRGRNKGRGSKCECRGSHRRTVQDRRRLRPPDSASSLGNKKKTQVTIRAKVWKF